MISCSWLIVRKLPNSYHDKWLNRNQINSIFSFGFSTKLNHQFPNPPFYRNCNNIVLGAKFYTRITRGWTRAKKLKFASISIVVLFAGVIEYLRRNRLDLSKRAPQVPLELIDILDQTQKTILTDNFDKALELRHQCYQVAQESEITDEFKYYAKKSFVGIDIKLGDLALKLNKLDYAESFYYSAFRVIREIEEPGSNCMIEISLRMIPLLTKKSMFLEAQEGYEGCVAWLTERKDKMNERDISLFSNVYHDYGLFLAHFARHDSAIECIDKSIYYLNQLTGVTEDMRIYLKNLKAVILLDGSRFDDAIECFTEILDRAKQHGLKKLVPILLYNLVSAHVKQKTSHLEE